MKINIQHSIYAYGFVYALLVTFMTLVVERLPVFLQMEFAIYDPIQSWFAIDSADDLMHENFKKELADIFCINLDASFFDSETNRVKRDRLGTLLEKLNEVSQINVIFLDYLFEPLDSFHQDLLKTDRLLKEQMTALGDRLILPYQITFNPIPVWGKLRAEMISADKELLYSTPYNGYLAPMYLIGDDTYRYHKLRLDDGTSVSAIYALIQAIYGAKTAQLFKNVPNTFEINFVLRNDRLLGQKPALDISNSRQVLNWRPEELNRELSGKAIFIGRFDPLKNKYNRNIDSFKTPVKKSMNGIYLLINIYLNLIKGAYFVHAKWWLIFSINFYLALCGTYHKKKYSRDKIKKVKNVTCEIMIRIAGFVIGLVSMYYWFYIKFPFVITSLVFTQNHYLFRYYQAYTSKFIRT